MNSASPLGLPNVRRFVLFRIFFGARFYYPVFAILFLDYGLTLAHFAILNTVWAITIVALEVPTGALADIIGRKRLVVAASVLMLAEMLVLALVPLGNQVVVFWAFFLNRILSGAAEACASGADEALAYDSLEAAGRKADWPHVLDIQMRWNSAAMVLAMIIGALVYDPGLMTRLTGSEYTQAMTVRLPIWLTAGSAVAAILVALGLHEVPPVKQQSAWAQILQAGRWILATPRATMIIVVALSFDSITRLFLTLDSNYFRLIHIPEAWFGVINASFAVVGFLTPRASRWLVKHRTPAFNFLVIAALTLLGLVGLAFAWQVWGLVWIIPTTAGFFMVSFFASHYLNEITESRQRATVLSFRSLAQNLAYGTINLLFGALIAGLRGHHGDGAFGAALWWLPAWFALVIVLLTLMFRKRAASLP